MASFAATKKKDPTPTEKAFTTINAAGVSTFAQIDLIKSGLNDKNLDAWWTNITTTFNNAKNDIIDAGTYFKILNNVDIFIKSTVKKLNATFAPLYVKDGGSYVPHFENSAITLSDINELTAFNIKARTLKKDVVTIIDRMESYSKTKKDSVQRTVLSTYAMVMESVLKQIIRETDTLLKQAEAKSGTYPKVTPLPSTPTIPTPPPLPGTQKPGTLPPLPTTGIPTSQDLPTGVPLPPPLAPAIPKTKPADSRPASPILGEIEKGAQLKHVEPSEKPAPETTIADAIKKGTELKHREVETGQQTPKSSFEENIIKSGAGKESAQNANLSDSESSDEEWEAEAPLLTPGEKREIAAKKAKIEAAIEKQKALDKENAEKLAAYKAKEASLTPEEKKARAELQAIVDKKAAEDKAASDKALVEGLAKRRKSVE
jgi:hypothetical protein